MKIEIEHVEELLSRSKGDIFPEDFIAENGIEEGSEEEEFIYENFNSIKHYVITRLETRLAFMKNALKE